VRGAPAERVAASLQGVQPPRRYGRGRPSHRLYAGSAPAHAQARTARATFAGLNKWWSQRSWSYSDLYGRAVATALARRHK